jgi:hypothetical protein
MNMKYVLNVGTFFLYIPHNIRPFAVVSFFRPLFFMVVFMYVCVCVSAGFINVRIFIPYSKKLHRSWQQL